VKHCIFEGYEHFQKMSFRNRCVVAGPAGPLMLSIPLEGGRDQKRLMKDVRLTHNGWQAQHWKTLQSLYSRSPFFEFFQPELEQLYTKQHHFLVDWNYACFEWVCDKLSISPQVSWTGEYRRPYPTNEYLDWRGLLKPSTINIIFPGAPQYPQVFEDRTGFVPNLSVLDYLFCTGGKGR